METGKPETYRSGPLKKIMPITDGAAACRTDEGCPKGTAETAHKSVLNWRNEKLLRLYLASQAGLSVASDALTQHLFAIVHGIFQKHKRKQSGEDQAAMIVQVFGKAHGV